MDEIKPFRSGSPSQHAADDQVCWTALAKDAGCRVAILDQTGAVEFANGHFHFQSTPDAGTKPTSIFELYTEPLAEERLRIARRALSTSSCISLIGLVNGSMCRETFRPLSNRGEGVGRVLLVSSDVGTTDSGNDPSDEIIRAVHDDAGPLSSLTKREVEVLTHIGKGLSTADIAKALHRSVKTVEWHRVSLGNKLGVANRVELARIAIKAGLCTLND